MKVLTTNHPIVVDGQKESNPSDYLSADGDFYEARGRRRRGLRKAFNYIPAVAVANKLSSADGVDVPDDYYGADASTDIITTTNPIVVGGKDISNPTWYMSADGERMSKKRAGNVASRIAKNQREIAHAQSRIDSINARVTASGKPMGRVDQNVINSLQKMIKRKQALLDSLLAMQSSSADGDDYYGADSVPTVAQGGTPTANQLAEAKKKGLFWDKVKGGWVYAKESGILDWVGSLLGVKPPPPFQPTPQPPAPPTGGNTTPPPPPPMSKTTKTLLMVGGALVIGFVIYEVVKKKK